MKKSLTKNITRFDNKMILRLDKRTLRRIIISGAVGIFVGLILMIIMPFIYAAGFGIMSAILLFALQIVEYDGLSLASIIKIRFMSMITGQDRVQYEHTSDESYIRLNIEEDCK